MYCVQYTVHVYIERIPWNSNQLLFFINKGTRQLFSQQSLQTNLEIGSFKYQFSQGIGSSCIIICISKISICMENKQSNLICPIVLTQFSIIVFKTPIFHRIVFHIQQEASHSLLVQLHLLQIDVHYERSNFRFRKRKVGRIGNI